MTSLVNIYGQHIYTYSFPIYEYIIHIQIYLEVANAGIGAGLFLLGCGGFLRRSVTLQNTLCVMLGIRLHPSSRGGSGSGDQQGIGVFGDIKLRNKIQVCLLSSYKSLCRN
jgi:hypothetical protein